MKIFKKPKAFWPMPRPGFSLAEILVSIGILVMMSTIVLANYRYYGNRNDLNISAQKLANDIRRVQSYALGLKEFEPIGDFPAGGWGIRFHRDDDHYLIYADIDENIKYNGNELFASMPFARSGTQILGRLTVTDSAGGVEDRNYVFITIVPPEPQVRIWSSPNPNPPDAAWEDRDAEKVEITIELSGTSYTRKIVINKFGLIDIED